MASDAPAISPDRVAAGAAVLALTDRVGFDAYAAAWVHDGETGIWRYVLSTPMLGTHGPEWVYARLLRAFRHDPLPQGLSALDVFVIDPAVEDAVFGPVGVGAVRVGEAVPMAGRFGDGHAYYFRLVPQGERTRDPSRQFDRHVRRLKAA